MGVTNQMVSSGAAIPPQLSSTDAWKSRLKLSLEKYLHHKNNIYTIKAKTFDSFLRDLVDMRVVKTRCGAWQNLTTVAPALLKNRKTASGKVTNNLVGKPFTLGIIIQKQLNEIREQYSA